MIVLDAGVLIGYLDHNDAHHQAARRLADEAADAYQDLLVNPITLAEILVGPTRAHRADEALAALAAIGVIEKPLPGHASRSLADLRVGTGLKLPDCCVLLTALDQQATLASFDDRLTRAAAGLVAVHLF